MMKLSEQTNQALMVTYQLAQRLGTPIVTPEHLLLGLALDKRVQQILQRASCNLDQLRVDLQSEITRTQSSKSAAQLAGISRSPGFERVVQKALLAAQSAGRTSAEVEHVLLAVFDEKDSSACYCLTKQGLDKLSVAKALGEINHEGEGGLETAPAGGGTEEESGSALDKYAENLNEKAKSGRIDPLVGRETEVARMMQTLCRRRKNNPILVGEPGVGKTALAEGLAWRIVKGTVPDALKDLEIRSLDLGAMLAGTKYRGDFEARIKKVVDEAKARPNVVLFIDEIHGLIGAGAAGGSPMDAATLIKPALVNGSLRVIGSTTFDEYRQVFEKDRALARRFQKIDVVEPSPVEALAILMGLKAGLEAHHRVTYSAEAMQAAVDLSVKYLTGRLLPDKAIDLVDEAGARRRLETSDASAKTPITVGDIEAVVAQIAKIPAQNVSSDDRSALAELVPALQRCVFGQDEAIARLCTAVKVARAGLNEGKGPLGSFLFVGPTGVGKTEVTRCLAQTLGVPLLRFDMSEYMEAHSVARLIGAPPGYVGHNSGGLLTEAVTRSPYAVVLLDEIEKAHPDVFNLLLQVMDNGSLTDSNGRSADFRNTIVVMTSNVGAQQASRRTVGFVEQNHGSDTDEAVRRTFSPEFRNRLDATVRFGALSRENILRVVDKNLADLARRLEAKNVSIAFAETVRQWLADTGFDPLMGARPMSRLINDRIKVLLADLMLFGDLKTGGRVTVSVNESGPSIEAVEPAQQTAVPAAA